MSRLGKVPVSIPDGVKVNVAGDLIKAEGPKGKAELAVVPGISVSMEDGGVLCSRSDDSSDQRARQGLMRSLVTNLITGVNAGFSRTLELEGVGYRADVKGSDITLQLGYSHPIVYQLPEGVKGEVDKQSGAITVSGIDKQLVGEVAAGIRKLRPPEPYKGKGVRYQGEYIRRKAGKTGAGG